VTHLSGGTRTAKKKKKAAGLAGIHAEQIDPSDNHADVIYFAICWNNGKKTNCLGEVIFVIFISPFWPG
jgi:hypothetical protein